MMEGNGGEKLLQNLEKRYSPRLWQHVLETAQTARSLALHWGCDPEKAYIAGLLHDLAKELPDAQMLAAAVEAGLCPDTVERQCPRLLHGPVAAVWARREYGINDETILAAIDCHTTGRAGMTTLDKVLYLADAIEPMRDFPGVESLRDAAFEDLDGAIRMGLSGSIREVLIKGGLLHPASLDAWNDLIG